MSGTVSHKMKPISTKKKLIADVFSLISGRENEIKALEEVKSILGVQLKFTITRRIKYSPAEVEAVEKIFKKYGVTQNIWTDAAN